MSKIELIKGDCLEKLKDIPDNSIDLVLIDPPYNIDKADWDTWKTVEDYIEFLKNVFLELQRVLKENGSFYFFHNDFLQIVEIQNMINKNTDFIFKQFIVWNKRFNDCKNKGFLDGFVEVEKLRNYQKMAEYCLFYTFEDSTGRKKIDNDINNYKSLREYSRKIYNYINLNKKQIINNIGQKIDHFFRFNSSQFSLPTEKTYKELTDYFNLKEFSDYKEYEELRQEYEELRQEYENQRYVFNNQKIHHSVWNYNISSKEDSGIHITPKPIDLLENIILHSSNEEQTILDCFMGSGSTGVACINTNRKFIGIELDDNYFEIAKNRIENHKKDL